MTRPHQRRAGGAAAIWMLVAVSFGAPAAAAEAIRISVTTEVSTGPYGLSLDLELRNDGDAAAMNVTPLIAFRGSDVFGTFVPALEPMSSARETITIPVADGEHLRGAWPVLVRVAYSDRAHHPFDALHVTRAAFGAPLPGRQVTLLLSGAHVETSRELMAELESPVRTTVSLQFFTTGGLAVVPLETTVTLNPTERRRLAAIVTNAGATPASRLPVFAVAQYESDGGHDTVIASGVVDIVPQGTATRHAAILGALIVLLLAWVVVAFLRRRSPAQ